MFIQVKWSRAILIIVIALLAITVTTCFFHDQQSTSAEAAIAAFDEQSSENKLLVYIFLDAIQEQSNQFYEPYYTIAPTVAYYSTYVSNIKDNGANIEVTFFSLPYIGPHDTIGEDEITFQARHTGEITPISFRHLKSYSLPDNLITLQKALPPVAEKTKGESYKDSPLVRVTWFEPAASCSQIAVQTFFYSFIAIYGRFRSVFLTIWHSLKHCFHVFHV